MPGTFSVARVSILHNVNMPSQRARAVQSPDIKANYLTASHNGHLSQDYRSAHNLLPQLGMNLKQNMFVVDYGVIINNNNSNNSHNHQQATVAVKVTEDNYAQITHVDN